jgi:hypothetical protein
MTERKASAAATATATATAKPIRGAFAFSELRVRMTKFGAARVKAEADSQGE